VTVSDYFQPTSLDEALAMLAAHGPELLVIAGGTVAMPLINDGISLPRQVMGLRRAGLERIERVGDELHIGATATLTALLEQRDMPMLSTAAGRTGSWAIRNMGTVGGNLFTPPPGGDVATALLALDARLVIDTARGSRGTPLSAFYTGFMTTDLAPAELVSSIVVPMPTGRTAFVKFGRRQANTPAVVTVAVHASFDGGAVSACRIALGSAGPHPLRAIGAEAALTGRVLDEPAIDAAAVAAAAECEPDSDAVASDWYRRRMVALFVKRALAELTRSAPGGEA
jgi:CO/xanthine dehydrogenase FAD-binding subunit